MNNQGHARCPNCELPIANVHYEAHNPNTQSGYNGSASFTAVAYPCGHAISAVPMTWESRLEELDRIIRELNEKIDDLQREVGRLSANVRDSNIKIK